ncbi:MAG: hypothetical protein JWM80_6294 [Cyanobacteria bacterium RYN_339]|nr:hypothetical protein [Cyanobacteria bacterium RYN_339]
MGGMTIACPHCDAPFPLAEAALAARDAVTCPACGAVTELDGERFHAEAARHLRRTFASTGPFPLQVRRFRVTIEALFPAAELPGAPLLAYFPALGRRPFAIGDNQAQALETLRVAAKVWQRGGNVSGELPPSDANAEDPWLQFEA